MFCTSNQSNLGEVFLTVPQQLIAEGSTKLASGGSGGGSGGAAPTAAGGAAAAEEAKPEEKE